MSQAAKTAFKKITKLSSVIVLGLFLNPAIAQIERCFAPGAIPDGSGNGTPGAPLISTVTYDDSDVAYTDPIIDLNFHLSVNSDWVGDVVVTLTSPAGTVVTLINRPGVPAAGVWGCAGDNIDVLLDDEAPTAAENQCDNADPTINGTQQPLGSLSDFDGETLEGTWTLTATDLAGGFPGSLLGTTCIDSSTTTPVTIGMFESKVRGNKLITEWQTSSESFNVGFNLWGLTASQNWVQLNDRIIRSKRGNTLVPQNYKNRTRLNKLDEEILAVGISSVSSSSKEDFFGPFEFGKSYGSAEVPDLIDWEKERSDYTASLEKAGFVYINGRYKRLTKRLNRKLERRAHYDAKRQQRFPTVNIVPTETGIQRITYADLLNAGVNWKNAPASQIAVTLNGKKVDRLIQKTNRRNRFAENSEIIFAAIAPQGENSRYIDKNIYQLSINRELVSRASRVRGTRLNDLETSHKVTVPFGENTFYANNMEGPRPWLDTELFASASTPKSHTVNFDVESSVDTSLPAMVRVNLLGGIDFPNVDVDGDGTVEPDHHVRLYLNKAENPDPFWEGYSEGFTMLEIEAPIAATRLLTDSSNELTIELIADSGNSAGIDIMSIDEGSIEYFKSANIDEDAVSFSDNRENVTAYNFSSTSLTNREAAVYAYDKQNHLAKLRTRAVNKNTKQISFAALAGDDIVYEIDNARTGFNTPSIELAVNVADEALNVTDAELLIIADPAFINDDLQGFAEFHRTELNRPTKIISTQDIYDRFGFSMPTPDAINSYLKQAAEESDYSSVLLVGGHTYNYLGYGNEGESTPLINSIPGFYADIQDAYEQQAPTENPFVDFDGDTIPEKAIGRWPVRNEAQLKNIIDKTIVWHSNGSLAEAQSALLIAEGGKNNIFKDTIEDLIPNLGGADGQWTDITKVYIDDIINNQTIPLSGTNTEARAQIKQGIDDGNTLTIFSGHGSPTRWSFQDLVTPGTVDTWDNQGKPTMLLPLACYTSYYETISTNSLAHKMLLASDNAAVAISSSAVLAIEAHNKEFVRRLLIELTQNNRTLGESVMFVKQDLAATSSDFTDIVASWTTLADPTLSLNRIPVERPITEIEPHPEVERTEQ